jgi:hypothetical protein
LKSPVDASVNAFLIQLGTRQILVDTGSGELLGPKLNKMPVSLKAVGVSPEQRTDILLISPALARAERWKSLSMDPGALHE